MSPIKTRQEEPRSPAAKKRPAVSRKADGCPSDSTVHPPKSPANIGRSRLPGNLASVLQHTPPRSSRASKIKEMFTESGSRYLPFGDGSSTSSLTSEEEKRMQKTSTMNAAAPIWQQRPSDQLVGAVDSSSDEWTGDEEYLPNSIREKARMVAHARKERKAVRRELEDSSDNPSR